MRVPPAVLSPFNYAFKSNLVLLPEDFAASYTNEQQRQAQELADTAVKTYCDSSGRSYNSIYTDGDSVTHSLEIENIDGDIKEIAEANLNYQNNTIEYKFLNYKLDDNHKNTRIYANLKTNNVISVSIANNWASTPIAYSFKDGKPYMASYHTAEGKALAFFDKNARVQKVFYQEYDREFGTMELGKPEIFIKDSNDEFLPLNWV